MESEDRLSLLRSELVRRLGDHRFELWIGAHTTLECVGGGLRVDSPSQFQMQWLRRRLHDTLKECCRLAWGEESTLEYGVAPAVVKNSPIQPTLPKETPAMRTTVSKTNDKHRSADPRPGSSGRRAVSTFDNFVIGRCNELALRTAQQVVAQPGHYGPLLLYGPPGVGKTHLQYAVLNQLRHAHPRTRALRLTAEQFTAEFLAALDRRALPGFRHKYRSIDVLLVDDIQFLLGKRATLDEFLYTIDTLHERSRQVILACDRSPGDLQGVSVELVSRISGGLAIPLAPPDYSTRLGLVRQFATRLKLAVNDEIVSTIASQVAGSARQLQGAVNRLAATSVAHGQPVTATLARTVVTEFVQQNTPAVRLVDIQRAVCQVFGVEAASLKSDRKNRRVAEPRMLAMWLARKHTRAALGEIGEFFGRRSHSTVISAHRKIEHLVSQGAELSVSDRACPVEEAIRQVELALRTA